MANSDVTLKNKEQLDIYPITRERNVFDEKNVNLKTKFENVVFKDNDVHKFAEELRNESANILTGERLEFGTYRVYLGYTNKLKPNTTYTVSTTNNKPQNNGYNIYIYRKSDDTKIQQINSDYGKGLTKSTFTTSNDIVEGETYYLQFNGTYEGLTVSNPCLVQGNVAMDFTTQTAT